MVPIQGHGTSEPFPFKNHEKGPSSPAGDTFGVHIFDVSN
jgi:hypothetical protein